MNVGFIGCGKIGKQILKEALDMEDVRVTFIQDNLFGDASNGIPVIERYDETLYRETDLIVECATAAALKENLEHILENSDLMMFSATAFADPAFEERADELCKQYDRNIYLPHGAILGLDGIFDGKKVWEEVTVQTTKNPQSLGRKDKEVTVVYDGPARGACEAYPRNVNVHAEIAMAGIGFEKTRSKIVSDPSVDSNTHRICIKGEGISVQMEISSFTTGGVTGIYTPLSAVGSFRRVTGGGCGVRFV